jgi:hypothetical protein
VKLGEARSPPDRKPCSSRVNPQRVTGSVAGAADGVNRPGQCLAFSRFSFVLRRWVPPPCPASLTVTLMPDRSGVYRRWCERGDSNGPQGQSVAATASGTASNVSLLVPVPQPSVWPRLPGSLTNRSLLGG